MSRRSSNPTTSTADDDVPAFEPPTEPPHGFGDDEHRRALRCRPGREVLAWVEAKLGSAVTGTRARRGGSTSAIHEVRLADGRTAVLRRYVLPWVIEEEPDLVEREVRALRVVARADLPTPELLAADPDGATAGVPCVLMSRLPGRVEWSPGPDTRALDRWLEQLADVLVALHATPLPPAHGLGPFDPYEPRHWGPPPWMRDKTLWDRAVTAFHARPIDDEQVLIHRDYHPGNVLWSRRNVTGVVDWPVARVGPSSADAYVCFLNLLPRFGREVAERFLATWEARSGRTYHPWAEVVFAIDVLDSREERRTHERGVLEERLGRALAALGLASSGKPRRRPGSRSRAAR